MSPGSAMRSSSDTRVESPIANLDNVADCLESRQSADS